MSDDHPAASHIGDGGAGPPSSGRRRAPPGGQNRFARRGTGHVGAADSGSRRGAAVADHNREPSMFEGNRSYAYAIGRQGRPQSSRPRPSRPWRSVI